MLSRKVKRIQNKEPIDWVHTNEFWVKHENTRTVTIWDSTDKEEENEQQFSGDPDTKFKFPKENEMMKFAIHNTSVLNVTKHYMTVTSCIANVKQSQRVVPLCEMSRNSIVKCTWASSSFTHTKMLLTCQKCGKQFKFWCTYLEHVKYCHQKTKRVECPICHKMFWTPILMRSHHNKQHRTVAKLVYGQRIKRINDILLNLLLVLSS